ncbi:acyl carrier protein [Streptomyces atroolivaceus]|uniref:Acyl carrier protein n=1 Tax=Streptomyces atroolivaceus TaxID=66869 RepID=A0ABV9VEV1_STRAZ|nr:acyl carrier protein [Streptomyces atroolivaceus]
MKSLDDFLSLVHSETGLSLTPSTVGADFDELPGWDSLLLLTLLTAIERETGRRVPMAQVLESTSLRDIYALTAQTVEP